MRFFYAGLLRFYSHQMLCAQRIGKRALPLRTALALVCASFPAHTYAAAATPQDNLLVVYVDDLGFGDTGAYGHSVVSTPNIDRLAAEGVRFTQFYAPSALCSPSRAGLLTGRTPYRTGVRSWIPDDSPVALGSNETTLADLAKQRGYRTAVIGKWHLNGGLHMQDAPQPRDFGFDYQFGLAAWVKNAAVANSGETPRRGPMYPDNFYRNNQPIGPTRTYSAELVTNEALTWIDSVEEPFFLLLTYSEVHTPIASPASFRDQYAEFLTPEATANPQAYYFDWRNRPPRGKGEYYANISYLDQQLGRVLDHLRENGKLDKTLVIFSSDNGPVTSEAITPWELGMAGETGGLRGKKRFLFEGGIRVPGIIRYPPSIKPGTIETTPVTALDIFPTIANWLGVTANPQVPVDGIDLWPLFAEDSADSSLEARVLYWSLPTPDGMEFAIRKGNWKLILDDAEHPRYLFNLDEDHYEVINHLDTYPETVAALVSDFKRYRASVNADPLLAERASQDDTPRIENSVSQE